MGEGEHSMLLCLLAARIRVILSSPVRGGSRPALPCAGLRQSSPAPICASAPLLLLFNLEPYRCSSFSSAGLHTFQWRLSPSVRGQLIMYAWRTIVYVFTSRVEGWTTGPPTVFLIRQSPRNIYSPYSSKCQKIMAGLFCNFCPTSGRILGI